eukprot:scaffold26677_cov188-Skeletonema_menzelii.AAC.7
MAAEGGSIVWFTYTGADGEVIDDEATHVIVQARVIRAIAFHRHPNIVEVICNDDVEKIEEYAFFKCPSLRRIIMRGVKVIEWSAFKWCTALHDVECGKLEIIGQGAFWKCESLRSINLTSARIVEVEAFRECGALEDVKFGGKLERIEMEAFRNCKSLERITIPLKDGLINDDDVFMGCENLDQVDLVEGELHETIDALHSEEWKNDMNEDIATTLEIAVSNNDIVLNNVLPFLELPSFTFELEADEDDEDDSDGE